MAGTINTQTRGTNQYSTPTHVMKQLAVTLINNSVFCHPMNCNRRLDMEFRRQGRKVGDTIYIRLPQRFVSSTGKTLVKTGIEEPTVPVTIDTQRQIGLSWDSFAEVFYIQDVQKREYDQMIAQLSNDVDYDGLSSMVPRFSRSIGTPGTNPGKAAEKFDGIGTYLDAMAALTEVSIPKPYVAMLSPKQHAAMVKDNIELFNPQRRISANFRTGQFAGNTLALGIDRWYGTQNMPSHRVGKLGGTPLLSSALAEGATSCTIDGGTAAVVGYLNKGDVINFGDTAEVNPMNRDAAEHLFSARVTADVDMAAGGTATIPFYPAVKGPNAGSKTRNQNVDALPANDDAITVFGHASDHADKRFKSSLLYNPNAVVLAMADLPVPRGMWIAERVRAPEVGLSLRLLKQYSIESDDAPTRLDLLYGWSFVRDLGMRVAGK